MSYGNEGPPCIDTDDLLRGVIEQIIAETDLLRVILIGSRALGTARDLYADAHLAA